MCEALLTLHTIADEACAGLFVALDRSDGQGCRLSRPRARAAGEDRIAGASPFGVCSGAAQDSHAAERESGLLSVCVCSASGSADAVAQASGPSSGHEPGG